MPSHLHSTLLLFTLNARPTSRELLTSFRLCCCAITLAVLGRGLPVKGQNAYGMTPAAPASTRDVAQTVAKWSEGLSNACRGNARSHLAARQTESRFSQLTARVSQGWRPHFRLMTSRFQRQASVLRLCRSKNSQRWHVDLLQRRRIWRTSLIYLWQRRFLSNVESPLITGPPNVPVLFCSLTSVVCRRRL